MKAKSGRLKVPGGRVTPILVPVLLTATLASADAGGAAGGGMSPLTMIFLGLLAAIILLQLVPAMVLFGSMIVAVFKRSLRKSTATDGEQA